MSTLKSWTGSKKMVNTQTQESPISAVSVGNDCRNDFFDWISSKNFPSVDATTVAFGKRASNLLKSSWTSAVPAGLHENYNKL